MKDHIKAKWVNKITRDAKKYAGTQQLREHVRAHVLGLIEAAEVQAKQEQKEINAKIIDYCIINCSTFSNEQMKANREVEAIKKFLTELAEAIREGSTMSKYVLDGTFIASKETSCSRGYCHEHGCDFPNCANECFKYPNANEAREAAIKMGNVEDLGGHIVK